MNTVKTGAVFTTTRAGFGLWTPLLREIEGEDELAYELFVGGTHLLEKFGKTIWEIEQEGFESTDRFDFLGKGSQPKDLVQASARELNTLAEFFEEYDFDFVFVLGDRFEFIPIVQAAILFRKPIVHIHGGESAEGAIDEQIRHMITKASHLHFAACEEYADNIRKMGEAPERVFNTGALGIDLAKNRPHYERDDLFGRYSLDPERPLALMTYHPVTLEYEIPIQEQVENIFEALSGEDLQLLITAPNTDYGENEIIQIIQRKCSESPDYHFEHSLGINDYHNMIEQADFVIGNSSSGILEVPFYRKPTVNIGDRQNGRIRHESVIDTDYSSGSISKGIHKALSKDFREKIQDMDFRFGDGNAAKHMVEVLKEISFDQDFMRKRLEFPE